MENFMYIKMIYDFGNPDNNINRHIVVDLDDSTIGTSRTVVFYSRGTKQFSNLGNHILKDLNEYGRVRINSTVSYEKITEAEFLSYVNMEYDEMLLNMVQ